MSRYGWHPYIPVAQRRQRAAKKLAKLRKAGRKLAPVEIEGRKIARSFWGSAWCDNLEAYSDYANRLPRGRTYVRNGSVVDLQIANGRISALVSGTDFYEVELRVKPLSNRRWKQIRSQCAGRIDSVVELLQGRISDAVMKSVTQKGEGLFPTPKEISLDCSCPDWATMCKHVAAALYGVGSRLDDAPEMLFELRGVDPTDMVGDAVGQAGAKRKAARGRMLAEEDLSAVFGVDIEGASKPARGGGAGGGKKAAKKKTAKKAKAVKKKPAVARKKAAKPRKNATASKKRSSKRERT